MPDPIRRSASDAPTPSPGGEPVPPAADGPPTFVPEAVELLKDLHLFHEDGPEPDQAQSYAGPADADAPRPVGLVGSAFQIQDEIGRGGMGVVFRARQIRLDRTVALKMVLPRGKPADARPDPIDTLRFFAEAADVAAILHPNVVQVYECGEHEGRPYFAMEFAEGGSLGQWLRDRGRLAPAAAAAVVEKVARGVHAAHRARIIHRDLKPSNILLVGESARRSGEHPALSATPPPADRPESLDRYEPKVADFGLACRAAAPPDPATMAGTLPYMAPEQADGRGQFTGAETDVYALGAVLYECLTGRKPFEGRPSDILDAVINADPTPPREIVSGVSADLDLVCRTCLKKNPHERYPSAEALANDLMCVLQDRPVSVRRPPLREAAGRWVRQHKALTALAVLLALVAVLVPALIAWAVGQHQAATHARESAEAARLLADAQELMVVTGELRTRSAARPAGWTWANRTVLTRAAALAGGDPDRVRELRGEAASVLLSFDARPTTPIAAVRTGEALAVSPGGAVVAVGEASAREFVLPLRVWLLDPGTGAVARELTLPPTVGRNKQGAAVPDGVWGLAYTDDGRRLFAVTRFGWVHRFDLGAAAAAPAASWRATERQVTGLAVGRGGEWVYTADGAGPLKRWAAADGAAGGETAGDFARGVAAVAVHPRTGDVVACTGARVVRLDPDTLAPTATPLWHPFPPATCLRFSPDGLLLMAGFSDQLTALDPDTLALAAKFTDPELQRSAQVSRVRQVAFHPGGEWAATCGTADDDRAVKVWSVPSGRLAVRLTVPGTGRIELGWAADGQTLLATARGEVARFEVARPAAARFAAVQPAQVTAAGFADGGRAVATLGLLHLPGARAAHPVVRAALARGGVDRETAVLAEHGTGGRQGLAVRPGHGRVALTCAAEGISFWDGGGPPVASGLVSAGAWSPAYSPDGRTLWAVVGPRVRAWDADGGIPVGIWAHAAEVTAGQPSQEVLAAGNRRAAVGGLDGTLSVLTRDDPGWPAGSPRPGDPVTAVALSPDEETAVAGGQSGALRVVRAADRAETAVVPGVHPEGLTAAAFGPAGELLATGGRDRSVRLWRRAGAGFEPLLAVGGLPAPVRRLEFDPAGGALLVVLEAENGVRVWDVVALKGGLAGLGLGW